MSFATRQAGNGCGQTVPRTTTCLYQSTDIHISAHILCRASARPELKAHVLCQRSDLTAAGVALLTA